MSVSAIVVSWNTRDLLAKCLKSVLADPNGAGTDLWVVDNASNDGTGRMVRETFPQVSFIESSMNLGFARASNIVITRTRGRHILLLNPDTQVEPGAIGQMSRFLDDNQSAGAVGPMLLGLDGAMQESASPAPNLLRELSRMFRIDGLLPSATYDTKRWDMDRPHEVDVLQGACFMLRRDSLEQVGLLDEDYFMYSEEVDLCYRLRKAGWSIHWLPQAKVMHHGGQSSKQVPVESFLNLYKGKITYFRKQHGMATAFAYKLILATASIARLMVSPLALLDQRERRDRHLALAGRYRRLLMELPSL